MRPEILFPLFARLASLPRVGPKSEKLLARVAAGARVVDLLWLLPSAVVDRSLKTTVANAPEEGIVTLTLTVDRHQRPRGLRAPYRVLCHDETSFVSLVFFHADERYLARALPVGATRLVSGRLERFQERPQITHPDYILAPDEAEKLPSFEPIYSLTAGLSNKVLSRAMSTALARTPELPEWQDEAFRNARDWRHFRDALSEAHHPRTTTDILPEAPARARLAYDEFLANQLALALTRARLRGPRGRALKAPGTLRARAVAALPYKLTRAQEQALAEILADMASERRMLRLLQGDVGSGKTVVAFLAMLDAVEAGTQAAFMAPTELLARQHEATIAPLARAAGVQLSTVTGRDKGRARAQRLSAIAKGESRIIIGTHALIEQDVAFAELGLAVVDEQHRFGVHQRLALSEKGGLRADVLVMTATPIPRTLTLTAYGDMDVSRLTEKPSGRKPVTTRVLPLSRLEDVVAATRRALRRGERVFWVCPLVEESDVLDIAAAEARHRHLTRVLGARVGLVHGRLKPREKDRVMAEFQAGKLLLLVATTVIEVGVDVPEATIMVIEHAERFGLAQLHQLRGRVGRGRRPGSCLLLYQPPLGETAKARLAILRETDDGFRIAEEDLRLRGAGELLGVRQSGLPAFRLATLPAHQELLDAAHAEARLILERDPTLQSARGRALRVLLYLFERDEAVRLLRSG
jgi:ATP-dependent DNA helicase RecG